MTPKTLFRSDIPPTLEEAQAFVGGYVELIQLGERQMLVREDGLLIQGLRTNHEATQIAGNAGFGGFHPERGIVGNAMVLSGPARWGGEASEGDE